MAVSGDDQIWGEDGNDNIRDEDGGNDRLYGGAGEDTVYVVRTNSSAETVLLDGGEGHDRLYYWGGTYTSNGTSLVYGAGQMLGGAGDDFISAYMVGAVTIDAGDGNDLVEFGLGGASDDQPGRGRRRAQSGAAALQHRDHERDHRHGTSRPGTAATGSTCRACCRCWASRGAD
jgi:Ca2+-binding RTX toxin-like protein